MSHSFTDFPWDDVRRFLRSFVRDPGAVEDALQETAIATWENRTPSNAKSRKSWILTVARHKATSLYYHHKADLARDGRREDEPPRPEPDDDDDRYRRASVREAIRRIPRKYRQVLILHYFDKMRFRDIGRTLGMTEVNARVIAHRGREAVRGDLEAIVA